MLNFAQVALRRGPRLLFENATFTLHAGQRVGLTGANGTGKSSLFAMIRGELQSDGGDISLPPKTVIASVAQETPASDHTALDYVLDGDSELRQIQHALAEAERDNDGHRQAELHGRFDAIGGYTAPARAARLLHGLGFVPGQEIHPVNSFSGGWRMRLNLAQALMCRSDLLLLDEPTNHLDLDAVLWLESWLRNYPGTLLLISHDRDFLDAVVGHILHIEQGGVTLYTGNYSQFELQRAEALAQQQQAYERQQREIAHMQKFITRFKAKATKAKQAQSRIKALERMEVIAAAHADSPFHFHFREPEKLPSNLLSLEQNRVGYGDTLILDAINLSLLPGDRVGLLGANGAGKSTLIKLIAGELGSRDGERVEAQDLRIGYFAQHQLEQLRTDDTPMVALRRLDEKASEQSLRDYLGSFGFVGDRVFEPIGPFSGGEKARLVLSMVVYQRPNLLLLDEPTNHLDLQVRHALEMALQEFEGAMVVVSHDRHLLRSVTDQLLLVDDGRVTPFDGDLDDYRRWLEARRRDESAPADDSDASSASGMDKKARRQQEAARREKLRPLRKEVEKLETQVEKLGLQQSELEQALADPNLYEESGKDRLKQLLREKGEIDQKLSTIEEAWLEASEQLERAESELKGGD